MTWKAELGEEANIESEDLIDSLITLSTGLVITSVHSDKEINLNIYDPVNDY
jgi:hypothetical protein